MNTEKKLRGRPHKREEDKLFGRRVSMEKVCWDVVDDFLTSQNMDLSDLLRYVATAIHVANNKGESDEN